MNSAVLSTNSSSLAAPVGELQNSGVGNKTTFVDYLPLIAAVIALGGIYWTHRLSKNREHSARFAAAAKEFRVAFADELAHLESNKDPYFDIQGYLLTAYNTKHRSAIALFEGFVPIPDRERFRTIWHDYHSGQRVGGEPLDMFDMGSSYEQAMFIEYSGLPFRHPTMGPRELAIHRMRQLLSFAEFG